MEQFVIICAGLAGRTVTRAGQEPPVGQYLRAYRPEARDGQGTADWTAEPRLALRFASREEAFECWRQIPRSRPHRDDGKPNRPLTAFSVVIEAAPE